MLRIERLTPEQEAMLPVIRDQWLKIGLSTEPIDDDRAQAAIRLTYERAGLKPPTIWARRGSPMAGCAAAAMVASTMYQIQKWSHVQKQVWAPVGARVFSNVRWSVSDHQVWNQVAEPVRDQVTRQVSHPVMEQVWEQVGVHVRNKLWDQNRDEARDQVYQACHGLHDAGWLSAYDLWIAAELNFPRIEGLLATAREVGWWWPFDNLCIYTDRPSRISRDARNRLHCEDRMALEYPDGWGVYAWHGVRVAPWVITNPDLITIETIDNEHNTEIRRVLIERYGMHRYLDHIGAQTIETTEQGRLVATDHFNDDNGKPAKFVLVVCPSTGRQYANRVRPDVTTVREAIASRWRLAPSAYVPVQET